VKIKNEKRKTKKLKWKLSPVGGDKTPSAKNKEIWIYRFSPRQSRFKKSEGPRFHFSFFIFRFSFLLFTSYFFLSFLL
jgi:hypothetical protein